MTGLTYGQVLVCERNEERILRNLFSSFDVHERTGQIIQGDLRKLTKGSSELKAIVKSYLRLIEVYPSAIEPRFRHELGIR